jgi:hypothetical protein
LNIKLDYTIEDLSERQEIVDKICEENKDNLTPKNLETLSDYLINCMEKIERKEKKILTDNRMATVNKRETSFEGLVSKFENGEDGVYQLMRDDKNMLLSPKVSITQKDIDEIPFLAQIRAEITKLRALPVKNYIVYQMIIDLSQTQYLVKTAYRKPIQIQSFMSNSNHDIDWDLYLDFKNWHHVAAFMQNYSKLKTVYSEDIIKNIYWILVDFENIADAALEFKEPMLYDIMVSKIEGVQNQDVQIMLEEKYGKTYSIEYISSLFNNKIPKLIADEAEKKELLWRYTTQEKGEWKKCNRCGQVKLLHSKFFSKNNSSKTGFYSICKECRSNKKKGS